MARIYSRRKGKSGSKKPIKKVLPTWVRYKAKEVELLIIKLAKEGKPLAEIGLILRDTYGIPSTRLLTNKKISQIIADKKLTPELPDDLLALIKKDVLINKHLESNKKDNNARRGKSITMSKINRLAKYYKKTGRLPAEWKYDASRASILAE